MKSIISSEKILIFNVADTKEVHPIDPIRINRLIEINMSAYQELNDLEKSVGLQEKKKIAKQHL